MNEFKPPAPIPPKKRPFMLRMLLGMPHCYISNLVDKSYEMKMGQIWAIGRSIFMPNQPELVRRILVDDAEHFPKSDMVSNILKLLLGNGLFVANGEEWKRQRRMIDPAFAHARLQRVYPLMWEAAKAMHERLGALSDGDAIAVDEEMTHVTADVIFRTIFSIPLEQQGARLLFDAFNRFQESSFVLGFLGSTKLPRLFFRQRRKAKRAANEIRQLIEPMIRDRYERHRRGEELTENDILTSLITAVDPQTQSTFSFEELVDQTAFLFLAGHETSASALSWALYLIAMQPDVQERMHAESVGALGEREPEYGDVRKLLFTRDVFRETLRLYPPVGFLPREAVRHETMREKHIKPGDVMLVSPWLIHRHRVLWKKPDIFDPDRFAREESRESINCAYLPFSLGPRICMGAAFATQEAMLLLASLVRRFRFEPVAGHVPKPVGRLTIRSENGIRLKISRR